MTRLLATPERHRRRVDPVVMTHVLRRTSVPVPSLRCGVNVALHAYTVTTTCRQENTDDTVAVALGAPLLVGCTLQRLCHTLKGVVWRNGKYCTLSARPGLCRPYTYHDGVYGPGPRVSTNGGCFLTVAKMV